MERREDRIGEEEWGGEGRGWMYLNVWLKNLGQSWNEAVIMRL